MLHDDCTAAAALLQNDPQEGLRRLMELFGGPVHAICTAILRGHAEDADEAAADTFVRLWRNASSLPAGTALRGDFGAAAAGRGNISTALFVL